MKCKVCDEKISQAEFLITIGVPLSDKTAKGISSWRCADCGDGIVEVKRQQARIITKPPFGQGIEVGMVFDIYDINRRDCVVVIKEPETARPIVLLGHEWEPA